MRAMKRSEKVALWLTGAFLLSFGAVAYFTDGSVLELMGNLEGKDARASRNVAVNCRDKRNASLPYCQERRAETDSNWRGIVRDGGQANAFKLGR